MSTERKIGRYEVVRMLGRGGMAVVYLARQTDLDRLVALKELSRQAVDDPSFAQRFVRESRLAGSLAHPNIVVVHEYFEHEGTPYIAMEYVPGGSLRPFVRTLTTPQVAGVLEGLLAALTHAEHAGVVHRDLKPENLMVTDEGRIKITDFGIARASSGAATGFMTATGTTVGTPAYMAPEQAMGKEIGPRTDLYATGVLAYEMLAARLPFPQEEAPMAILMRHINEQPPTLAEVRPEVDPRLAGWVMGLLEKRPEDRPDGAEPAWHQLEDILIDVIGPRWRREARLPPEPGTRVTHEPLTPAPFESGRTPTPPSTAAPEPAPDRGVESEFMSFPPAGAGESTGAAAPEPAGTAAPGASAAAPPEAGPGVEPAETAEGPPEAAREPAGPEARGGEAPTQAPAGRAEEPHPESERVEGPTEDVPSTEGQTVAARRDTAAPPAAPAPPTSAPADREAGPETVPAEAPPPVTRPGTTSPPPAATRPAPTPPAPAARPPHGRRRLVGILAGLAVLAVGVGAAFAFGLVGGGDGGGDGGGPTVEYELETPGGAYQVELPAGWTKENTEEQQSDPTHTRTRRLSPDGNVRLGINRFAGEDDPGSLVAIAQESNEARDPTYRQIALDEQVSVDGKDALLYVFEGERDELGQARQFAYFFTLGSDTYRVQGSGAEAGGQEAFELAREVAEHATVTLREVGGD
ncbi:MAG TPA: protein kinase [Solirubrobacterales bacterium]|nr:protein kinase [Solirubrobacterales bacterium]